jgi:arylsulfatase
VKFLAQRFYSSDIVAGVPEKRIIPDAILSSSSSLAISRIVVLVFFQMACKSSVNSFLRLATDKVHWKQSMLKKRGTALKRADLVVERANKLPEKDKNEKFFLFIHFLDAHWPYEAPDIFGGNNYYENGVAYSDRFLNLFLGRLKKDKLYDNTTIICFSDYGEDPEGLYKNDKGGKILGHPEELGYGCLLYDQTQKVVLIIKDKNLPKNKQISSQVRLVDIVTAVLSLIGTKHDPSKFDGTSLLPVVRGTGKHNIPAYSETFYPKEQTEATGGKFSQTRNKKSIRLDNRYKFITHLESDKMEFHDLEKDLKELHSLL